MEIPAKKLCRYDWGHPVPSFVDANGDKLFLVAGESHGSDDYAQASPWSHYEPEMGRFSSNIEVVAITAGLNAAALLVKKKDPSLVETIHFSDGNGRYKISF